MKIASAAITLSFAWRVLREFPESERPSATNAQFYILFKIPRWDEKRWRGSVFLPPSLLPVPGRGKEADSAASANG